MPNLRCERFGPFDVDELKEELENLEFEYMMDLAPSKPPTKNATPSFQSFSFSPR